MKQADYAPITKRPALRQCRCQCIPEPLRDAINSLIPVRSAPPDAQIHPVEAAQPDRQSDNSKYQEPDLARQWQHLRSHPNRTLERLIISIQAQLRHLSTSTEQTLTDCHLDQSAAKWRDLKARLRHLFTQLIEDRRHNRIHVAHQPIISDFENRRLGIPVNRNDVLALAHPR